MVTPQGRITRADVETAIRSRIPAEAPEGVTRRPLSPLRRAVAKRLVAARNETAMLTTFNEVDMTAVLALRSRHGETFLKAHGIKLGFMSFAARAACVALGEVPRAQRPHRGRGDRALSRDRSGHRRVDRAGADRAGGAGGRPPVAAALEQEIARLAERGRQGKLSIDELSGGTFSITNAGVFGSLLATPLLNFPQSGILGLHVIQDRPVARDGQVVIRPMMYVSLSYDHRLVDGREAATFLVKVKEFLEGAGEGLLGLSPAGPD